MLYFIITLFSKKYRIILKTKAYTCKLVLLCNIACLGLFSKFGVSKFFKDINTFIQEEYCTLN